MNRNERAKQYHMDTRKLAVTQLGGKCANCGSVANLHIHHKNGIGHTNETILLCSQCHSEIHERVIFKSAEDGVKRIRTTIYLDPNVWVAFKKKCLTEGVSASRQIEIHLRNFS